MYIYKMAEWKKDLVIHSFEKIELKPNKKGVLKKNLIGQQEGWNEITKSSIKKGDKAFGLLTGEINNIIVLDFDDIKLACDMIDKYPILDEVPRVATKRGFHFYFKWCKRCKYLASKYGEHIDIQKNGKQVLYPPTQYVDENYDMFEYIWDKNEDEDLIELPKEIIQLLNGADDEYSETHRNKCYDTGDETDEEEEEEEELKDVYTKKELQNLIDKLPREAYCVGKGNYCFNMVCALKKAGATRKQVKDLCKKAEDDYDEEWFKGVWKQNTLKYNFGIAYVLSKSSWRRDIQPEKSTEMFPPVYESEDYLKIKEDFEKTNFRLEDVMIYVCDEKDNNGDNKFLMYKYEIFKQKYAHLIFTDYQKEYPLGKKKNFVDVWNTDVNKKTYKSAQVIPHDKECPDDVYNLWSGFACEKTILPEGYITTGLTKNINKLMLYLCEKNEINYKYFMKSLSHMVKFPSKKEKVAFFFTGVMGVGKSTLKEILYKLLGSKLYTEPTDADALFTRFNKSVRLNKLVAVLDEASNMKKNTKHILGMITNDKVSIEEKNEPKLEVMNCIQRLILLSNDVDIIKINNDDRRWVVFNPFNIEDVKEKEIFFNKVYSDINDKNIMRVFYDELMSNDVEEDYNFQLNRPSTEYYEDIKTANTPLVIKFLYSANIEDSLDNNKIKGISLYNHFCNWLLTVGIKYEYTNTMFGMEIKKHFKDDYQLTGIKKTKGRQNMNYHIDIDTLHTYIKDTLKYNGDF